MGDEDCIMVGPDGFLMAALPIGQPRDHASAFNDAAFIAAANPSTILAILSERAELLATVERMRGKIERLASSDAFDVPQAIDGPLAQELRMRLDYARAALTTGEGK